MKHVFGAFFGIISVTIIIAAFPCLAAEGTPFNNPDWQQDITQEPICFNVVNQTDHSVLGSLVTDYYMHPSGVEAKHRSNFRLEAYGTKQEQEGYPLDQAEFCSHGPFYPDGKLEFVLRTIVPVFSCKTLIQEGPIMIRDELQEDGTKKMVADCYE